MSKSMSAKRARTTESTPDTSMPDTSMLCGPVSRSWGKTEWIAWGKADEAHFKAKNDVDEENYNPFNPAPADPWSFDGYMNQRDAAIAWAAPSHVQLRVLVPQAGADEPVEVTVQLARDSQQPVRAILDGMCATASLRRDDFFWTFANGPSRDELVTAIKRGKMHDLCQATDRPVFPMVWNPCYCPESWESEHTFCRTIIAIAKPPPPAAPPAEEPAWPELKSPPPDGAASEEEWDEWQNNHSSGGFEFWRQYWDAVRFRCPPSVPICLKGLTHSLTLEAAADAPLDNLLTAFCAAAPTSAQPMSPGDLLVMNEDHSDTPLDAQCTSARELFTGSRSEPLELNIVYRDTARTQAEIASKLGPVPAGYQSFRGGGYLVGDNDTPWLVSDAHGVAAYNRVVEEALNLYDGFDYDFTTGYDPIESWWNMTKKLKVVLKSVVRAPKGGWTASSAERALDQLTGFLLATVVNSEWRHDARGKIMSWDPACRKESIAIMKQMDEAAVRLIGEAIQGARSGSSLAGASSSDASSSDASSSSVGLGLTRALDQTKRLLDKLQDEYAGWGTDGHGHKGYTAFKKALALLNA